jgi:hypothetical protein
MRSKELSVSRASFEGANSEPTLHFEWLESFTGTRIEFREELDPVQSQRVQE